MNTGLLYFAITALIIALCLAWAIITLSARFSRQEERRERAKGYSVAGRKN